MPSAMPMDDLPAPVADVCAALGASGGVEAVAIGGSRAAGTADPSSDWDIGVYYRGPIDLAPLARYGEVHPPGSWGRVMNGGAWLSLDRLKVDVLLRDLDVALHWTTAAQRGAYEVDALLGYVAGVPTYCLTAELALSRVVIGRLPAIGEYPEALAHVGGRRWSFDADFSVAHARMRAERGDVVGMVGQAAKAVTEIAHSLACRRRLWILNEKKLIERTGLQQFHKAFSSLPTSAPQLVAWVDALRASIDRARS